MSTAVPEPSLGLFFTPFTDGVFDIVQRSLPMSHVDCVGGFKTHPEGHISVWKQEIRKRPELRTYPYEYFPRGRVNWRADDDRFLFLADKIVFEQQLHLQVCELWYLDAARTIFMLDPHYKAPHFENEWRRTIAR